MEDSTSSDRTTRGIRVQARSFYVPERSVPQDHYFFFAYLIKISNLGERSAQLLSREWLITDGNGETQRVEGPGVVGEQPLLGPGESFEYTSFCPLPTAVGAMEGSYTMLDAEREAFAVEIAPFTLAVPGSLN